MAVNAARYQQDENWQATKSVTYVGPRIDWKRLFSLGWN